MAWLAFVLAAVGAFAQPTGVAVEYYHAGFDHYFITARASEIGDLDGGKFGGAWRRTGRTFSVWTAAGPGTQETCRFFTEAYAPKSSHFYTPLTGECARLRRETTWTFEDIAFHLKVDALGNCPAGSVPLHRLFNNGLSGAPNHRYTTSRAIFDQMVALGWKAEGAGPATVFACVPAEGDAPLAGGFWSGTTSAGDELIGATFDDGSYYFFYASPMRLGIVDGRAAATGLSFADPQGRDFAIFPAADASPATVTWTVVPQVRISGSIDSSQGRRTFTADYEARPGPPVTLREIAGAYQGMAVTGSGSFETVLTVSTQGGLTAHVPGCTISGSLAARGSTGLFDAVVTLDGGACALGNGTTTGVGLADPTAGILLIVARAAGSDDVFVFVGVW